MSQGKLDRSCAGVERQVALPSVTSFHSLNPGAPLAVRCVGRSSIEITWRDGHRTLFPAAYLRAHCLCALCRRQRGGRVELPVASEGTVFAVAIRPVGHYALGVSWSDGHGESLYRYERLRELCPCSACWHSPGGI